MARLFGTPASVEAIKRIGVKTQQAIAALESASEVAANVDGGLMLLK